MNYDDGNNDEDENEDISAQYQNMYQPNIKITNYED